MFTFIDAILVLESAQSLTILQSGVIRQITLHMANSHTRFRNSSSLSDLSPLKNHLTDLNTLSFHIDLCYANLVFGQLAEKDGQDHTIT